MGEKQGDRVEAFADNWTYLKAELNWLDRMLMLAVARQRKESKEVERVAQTWADRASSHWWKGLILVEGEASYDDGAPTKATADGTAKLGYQQQLQIRIQASQKRGIHLGLPLLCDRLQLTVLEKSVVLMSLAPEINRRYAKIYSYLQGNEGQSVAAAQHQSINFRGGAELPTVDLVLRLLCRNDVEWRVARNRLKSTSPLHRYALLRSQPRWEETFLTRPLQLADALVDYLLSDHPSPEALESLLNPVLALPKAAPLKSSSIPLLHDRQPTATWTDLVLPTPLLQDLQHLVYRVQTIAQLSKSEDCLGSVVLLSGPVGTGKTLAATAIAQALQVPLTWVDLDLVSAGEYSQVLQEIAQKSPKVLLIQSAQHWIGRFSSLDDVALHQFLQERQMQPNLTLLSLALPQAIRRSARQRCHQVLEFPFPDVDARAELWQRAIPPQITVDSRLKWQTLANRWELTGGEIRTIVRDAALAVVNTPKTKLKLSQITDAVKRYQNKHRL